MAVWGATAEGDEECQHLTSLLLVLLTKLFPARQDTQEVKYSDMWMGYPTGCTLRSVGVAPANQEHGVQANQRLLYWL